MSTAEIEIGSVHYTHSGMEWIVNEYDKANNFTFHDKYPKKYMTKQYFLVLDYIWHEDCKRVKLLSLDTQTVWWTSGFTWLNWFTPIEGSLDKLYP